MWLRRLIIDTFVHFRAGVKIKALLLPERLELWNSSRKTCARHQQVDVQEQTFLLWITSLRIRWDQPFFVFFCVVYHLQAIAFFAFFVGIIFLFFRCALAQDYAAAGFHFLGEIQTTAKCLTVVVRGIISRNSNLQWKYRVVCIGIQYFCICILYFLRTNKKNNNQICLKIMVDYSQWLICVFSPRDRLM